MQIEDIKNVGVVGAGTMGHGIAQVFATAGYEVTLRDVEEDILDRARKNIRVSLAKLSEQGTLVEDVKDVLERVETSTDLHPLTGSQLIVEAVLEQEPIKKDVFSELDQVLSEDVIFVSNTSSISITELASSTSRAEKFAGMHFFNPVPLMDLVEVVEGMDTRQDVLDLLVGLSEDIGKTPVTVKDFPGFVSNRILCPMINEAIYTLMEGVGEREEIDDIMKLGMGHPMGPLELADLVGLDVLLNVLEVLHEDLGEDKYRPCPLLRKKVEAGHLGKKTGQGFYSYDH